MNNQIKPITALCPYCCKENMLGFRNHFPVMGRRRKIFCNEKCYEKYKEQFFVEKYNGNKIYKFILNDKPFYVPYFDATYGFNSLEDCKKRINSKCAVVDLNVYRAMMKQFK